MNYEIIYSARRSISLCIKGENLIVRAPFKTPKSKIEELVSKHDKWIRTHLEKQRIKNEKIRVLTEEEIKALRKRAKEILPKKQNIFLKL